MATVSQIARMLERGHDINYDLEPVSQLEHALQCAMFAEEAGSSPDMITACLLHDIGHLIYTQDEDPTNRTTDFRHEERGALFLRDLFGPSVTEPIRLHVPAKRYLCHAKADYWQTLSPASKQSLEVQGGIFSAAQANAFIAQPYAEEAVRVRLWDDKAKIAGLATPDLAHFTRIMDACAL